MIFRIYSKVAVKLGDERYVFDRRELMLKDVIELETVSGYSYAEWAEELNRQSLRAQAALLHVLRKKNGVPSDFETMDFVAEDFVAVPLHPDGSEFTAVELWDDIERRVEEAKARAADPTGAAVSGNGSSPPATGSMSPSSQSGSTSAPGSGKTSPGTSSAASKRKRTGK